MEHQYASRIYLTYFRLGEDAYREKVRFVEESGSDVGQLPFDERVEIELDYLLCLFELGRYERYLQKADSLIETVITENIFRLHGINIYHELLFRKAASLYQTGQIMRASDILRQLIRLDAGQPHYMGLYKICQRRLQGETEQMVKALAISLLLLVVSITFIHLLVIQPILEEYIGPFLLIRNSLLILGLTLLAGLEIAFYWRIYRITGYIPGRFLHTIFHRTYRAQ